MCAEESQTIVIYDGKHSFKKVEFKQYFIMW